jgi:L-alanine-DL-glutamate epimerase-like enolase superfamily enzyme
VPEDEVGHAMLAQAGGIPIATGENFRTIQEFERMIRAGGVMFPEPDVSNCGGITCLDESGAPGRVQQPQGYLPRGA